MHCTDVSCCVAVAAVQDFCYLHEDICQNWGPVPQVVINALVPDKAVEHSRKMLPRDYRMRIFMPKDCQHGAMYLCQQAQVDLADSTRAGTSLFAYCTAVDCCQDAKACCDVYTNLGGCSQCCHHSDWAPVQHRELAWHCDT